MITHVVRAGLSFTLLLVLTTAAARAQPIGIELHNTIMPASGGMGGVSIAEPQDLLAALNGNPATLPQFRGTQFQFGGAYAEATINMNQTSNLILPGVQPYRAKSGTPGSVLGNIGLTQEADLLGQETVFSFGLISNAGLGVDYRAVPASNGTSAELLVLEMNAGAGTKLTDRLSAGANMSFGTAYFDGPFTGIDSMVPDYALRGSVGLNYDLFDATKLGFYFQSKQSFTFEDAIRLQIPGPGPLPDYDAGYRSIKMALPRNFGWGVANRSLCGGRLLLAFDILLKQWDDAALFEAVYNNQWAFQFGAQYSIRRVQLRAGYVYAQNPMKTIDTTSIGGISPPGGFPALNYVQAQLASFNRNRISFGVGMVDVVRGLDVDLFAGGMFNEDVAIGPTTFMSAESYYVGLGSTYRFGKMGRR